MDCRHNDPIISLTLWIDWANPLWLWFVGVMGSLAAAVLLVAVR
ncbi:MAG: hypothetical protein AB1435_03985 [Chloroflexota bacterium]|jgi:hypothetical protein